MTLRHAIERLAHARVAGARDSHTRRLVPSSGMGGTIPTVTVRAAPMALAASSDGIVWLADAGNRAIRRLAPAR